MILGPENPLNGVDTNEGLLEEESLSASEEKDLAETTLPEREKEEEAGDLPMAA